MSKILVVAEHLDGKLNPATARTVSAAQALNPEAIDVVVLAAGYSHVFGPSTTFGKDLMPVVAALLGVNQVSDLMAVEGEYTFKRPIYAGNAIVTVEAPAGQVVVATVRTASWPQAAGGNSAPVEAVQVEAALPSHTRYVGLAAGASDRPDLQSARRVVSGGRGVGSEENFRHIYSLADKGCRRPRRWTRAGSGTRPSPRLPGPSSSRAPPPAAPGCRPRWSARTRPGRRSSGPRGFRRRS